MVIKAYAKWAPGRRVSFWVHAGFVSIPFISSSVSSFLVWQGLFQSWIVAALLVTIIDALALTGFILKLAGIPSPFVPLRHALPFIAIVPLGLELYWLLSPHNENWIAVPVTILVTAIAVGVAFLAFRAIEKLFVDPITAAQERIAAQLLPLRIETAEHAIRDTLVREFFEAWSSPIVELPRSIEAPPAQQPPVITDDAEVMDRSKDSQIRALLDKGWTYDKIEAGLKVSSARIARVVRERNET